MKLVLASTSKYRRKILDLAFLKHEAVASDFEEKSNKKNNPKEYVKELALGKAKNIEDKFENSIILGMDTVVVAQGEVLEKPKDIEDAKREIRLCSEHTAKVITGVAIINQLNGQTLNFACTSKISFRKIPEKEIDFYIKNEKGALYSAGFVLETVMSNFIKKIEGSYYNILGAPVEAIYEKLSEWGYCLDDFQEEQNL